MGKEVRIAPTAILRGNLSVEIQTGLMVSQPVALSAGQTAVEAKERTRAQSGVERRRERGRAGAAHLVRVAGEAGHRAGDQAAWYHRHSCLCRF